MRRLLLIGIGTGNPEHVTIQAIRALNAADVIFMLDKGEATADLVRVRREICERYIDHKAYRIVEASDPERDRRPADYGAAVTDWHAARAALVERLILDELPEEGTGAILVWGDPSLYDSTIRIAERIAERGRIAFALSVIPGISSVQALAASHRIALNTIGGAVHLTTGRRLAQGLPAEAGSTVVMLDGDPRFDRLDPDLTIYWGAYLGTPDEITLAGRLGDVAETILSLRREARAQRGWIMDTYLLRRPG